MLRHDCIDTTPMPVVDSGDLRSWKSWITAGVRLLVSDLTRIVEILTLWQRRSTMRSRLQQFDERLLRDSGLTRAQVLREMQKPFWRV